VVIDNGGTSGQGGGAAKVSGYITDIIATLPSTVEALTGIDIMGKLKEGIDRQTTAD